ncbi:ferrous iron transporter B [Variovorax sp. J22G21]|uniref:ferrous iron transporter B n=1 Tax=Variovorax fucosicus TaxID=3053517 RepID=UPI00257692C8|nr:MULTISPECIES: ferrous iron transporter B [unclassified Variovorax]MDM0040289.1 ferrous iron transporter B [Variovorax sp. J22R193]MDM0061662.1 ferrous iron transporter B [Variovorax sp. J22G21]
MVEATLSFQPGATGTATTPPARIALLGNPNCGKTALFNLLTGSRQKVANYAGVTVERKEGTLRTAAGRRVFVLDLPGAYSLNALSADEAVTRDVVTGQSKEALPDLLVCVTDATNLRLNLRLVLEARQLGLPMVVALNMTDMAKKQGITVDAAALSRELGVPVIETVGVHTGGAQGLLEQLDAPVAAAARVPWQAPAMADVLATQREVRRILAVAVREPVGSLATSDRIDRIVLHPVAGMLVLAVTLFLMFQAVFSWATVPMDAIKAGTEAFGHLVKAVVPEGMLQSLLVDGIVAGVGGVVVFLPQILILFLFILALEDSGYLPRAAFLLDRVMGTVGLSGRSFIPLLSSFACAIPGVMATRTISNWRDRLTTIMIAPLMTCSARLPVYALLIAAFIPEKTVGGLFNLQGIVLFALYAFGIVSAMAVAWVMKRFRDNQSHSPLLMELPAYRWPNLRNLALGLYERAWIFLQRVGTIILTLTILLWFLSTFPSPPEGATGPAIQYSLAGMLGRGLEHIFAPIGFNWQISIALVPGMAAREVAVGALGTVYALSATGEEVAGQLQPLIASSWSLATALSLLVWYVFAPQCISTLAAVKRETNSWKYVWIMAGYLFALAYIACFITYRIALALGWG